MSEESSKEDCMVKSANRKLLIIAMKLISSKNFSARRRLCNIRKEEKLKHMINVNMQKVVIANLLYRTQV